jgi:hypothetical protein
MSSGLINSRTLVPPVPVATTSVTDEEWFKAWPGTPKRNWETDEQYAARTAPDTDPFLSK